MVRLAGVTDPGRVDPDPGRVDPDPGRIDPDPTLKQNLGPAGSPEFRDPAIILIWIFPYPDPDSAFCIIKVGYRGQRGVKRFHGMVPGK